MPIVIPVPIATAPPAPQRNDPATFEERNDAAIEYQFDTLPGAIDQQAEATYQNALDANGSAQTAEQHKEAAALSEQAAATSATAAASVAGASKWISGEAYTEGQAVWSPVNYQTYRRVSAGSGAVDPSIDTVNWAPLGTSLSQLHAVALSF